MKKIIYIILIHFFLILTLTNCQTILKSEDIVNKIESLNVNEKAKFGSFMTISCYRSKNYSDKQNSYDPRACDKWVDFTLKHIEEVSK